jgi:hypothetical protein
VGAAGKDSEVQCTAGQFFDCWNWMLVMKVMDMMRGVSAMANVLILGAVLVMIISMPEFKCEAKKLTPEALARVEADMYNARACGAPWPDLELMLPIGLKNDQDHHDVTHASWDRRYEWRDIFLQSYLLFWPLRESKTRLILMFDEEQRYHPFQKEIDATLNNVSDVLGYSLVRKMFNDAPGEYYAHKGHNRQQYIMFYAGSDLKFIMVYPFFINNFYLQTITQRRSTLGS